MGSCISACLHTGHTNPVPYPSPFITPHTTHIVAHHVPRTFRLWAFNYRLNSEPVVIGQRVVLYPRGMEERNPDPDQATPVVEGWIGMITGRGTHWVTFGIVNSTGVMIAQMCYPGYPPQLLDTNDHQCGPPHPPCPSPQI
ncbi:hypothetical protein PILCRDRAFT_6017 [Piloderma croceum F 1598]|uniref:Uncharacterized protein n=1 Tax=Piloderma croceum (strain F 1598) TaxID=765440 RepID=A0A0C3G2Y5_PILCF|nr:hypothetical protein PILCRDRAFT_6017 [Piloderma croceum F 1598]